MSNHVHNCGSNSCIVDELRERAERAEKERDEALEEAAWLDDCVRYPQFHTVPIGFTAQAVGQFLARVRREERERIATWIERNLKWSDVQSEYQRADQTVVDVYETLDNIAEAVRALSDEPKPRE